MTLFTLLFYNDTDNKVEWGNNENPQRIMNKMDANIATFKWPHTEYFMSAQPP